jgi:hypothetical protein
VSFSSDEAFALEKHRAMSRVVTAFGQGESFSFMCCA